MPTVSTYIDVDVDLEDFSDEDLLDELDRRGKGIETVGENTSSDLLTAIYHKRRTGKDYQRELDELIYQNLGRIA